MSAPPTKGPETDPELRTLQCDKRASCYATPTVIDNKGFIYCGFDHSGDRPTRKLTDDETNGLKRGQPVNEF